MKVLKEEVSQLRSSAWSQAQTIILHLFPSENHVLSISVIKAGQLILHKHHDVNLVLSAVFWLSMNQSQFTKQLLLCLHDELPLLVFCVLVSSSSHGGFFLILVQRNKPCFKNKETLNICC